MAKGFEIQLETLLRCWICQNKLDRFELECHYIEFLIFFSISRDVSLNDDNIVDL